jgi:multisubunit Na+/H+ antiporter MnhE subunit
MGLFAKLLLSLIVATIASTLTSVLLSGELFDLRLLIAFFLATASTALIVRNNQVSTHPHSETLPSPRRPSMVFVSAAQ